MLRIAWGAALLTVTVASCQVRQQRAVPTAPLAPASVAHLAAEAVARPSASVASTLPVDHLDEIWTLAVSTHGPIQGYAPDSLFLLHEDRGLRGLDVTTGKQRFTSSAA
ncbi:MAG: hypothetical protein QM756_33430 [Polyangiaceae bacterium]